MKRFFITSLCFFSTVCLLGQVGNNFGNQDRTWPQFQAAPTNQDKTQQTQNGTNQHQDWTNQRQNGFPQMGPYGGQQAKQFSPIDYRNRQKDFITKHAGLTDEEAEKFFPLYYELQQKKRELNREAREQAVHPQGRHFTEEEYTKIVDNMANLDIKIAQLEKSYIDKYKEVIPASKILKVQMAEEQFNSEILKDIQHQRSWNYGSQNYQGPNQFYNNDNNQRNSK